MEVNQLAQGHTARKWQEPEFDLWPPAAHLWPLCHTVFQPPGHHPVVPDPRDKPGSPGASLPGLHTPSAPHTPSLFQFPGEPDLLNVTTVRV